MKGLQLKVFFTTCFFAYLNAQMQDPGMQGGGGGYPGNASTIKIKSFYQNIRNRNN